MAMVRSERERCGRAGGAPRRIAAVVGLVLGLVACSREEVARDLEVAIEAPRVVIPEPIDLRTLELDPAPDGDVEPGDWVRCEGGVLRDRERTFEACRERSLTWAHRARERVWLVATAANATLIEVGERVARFVDGRARIEVDLRTLSALAPREGDQGVRRSSLTVRIEGEDGHAFVGVVELARPINGASDGSEPAGGAP